MDLLDELHVYLDREPRSAALQMALDEALLQTIESPTLRFYCWRGPALSFGYFGAYAEVANQSDTREIVRRWTGGGIVLHGDDLTYSVIVPARHTFFARSPAETYSDLHGAIQTVLTANGTAASLKAANAPKISENCFANAVRSDVMSNDGRKIAGAAQRRSRVGLLHQGSIQGTQMPQSFREDFARALCDRFEWKNISQALIERASEIVKARYDTVEWLMRR